MTDAYEFTIAGRLSPDLVSTFEPTTARSEHDETVFVRTVSDDAELFGVISRCEILGLHLVSLRKLTPDTPTADYPQGRVP
ncbi:MAG: hypothetical protein ABWX96_18235 [Propionibacteriaceae bacterium]